MVLKPKVIVVIVRLALFTILAVAGVAKIFSIKEFQTLISANGILPISWTTGASYAVIATEISTASLAALGQLRLASLLAAILFSTFLVFHAWNLLHGIGKPCTCLGPLFQMSSKTGIALTSVLLLLSSFSYAIQGKN